MSNRKHPFIAISYQREIGLKNTMTVKECEAKAEQVKRDLKEKTGLDFLVELCNTVTCVDYPWKH